MSAQSPDYQPQFSLWVRQLLTVVLLIVGIYLLTLIAPVLPMLTVSFLIAFVMFIPSRSIARRTPVPYAVAVILLYALLIIIIVLGMLIVTPSLLSGINSLLGNLEQGFSEFALSLQALRPQDATVSVFGVTVNLADTVRTAQSLLLTGAVARTPGFLLPPTVNIPPASQQLALGSLINQVLPLFGSVSQTVTSAITGITGFIGSFLIALFVSFLVLLDVPTTQAMLGRQIPDAYHREFALVVKRVVHVWNGFFRGQVLIGFAIGVLTFIQLSWMGISNTFTLAVLTGLISLIPTVGGILALIPLSLIPLITGSTTFPEAPHGLLALITVVINLVISQVIWNVLAPKILGDALDLPLPVIIVGVFIGAAAAGVLGAFLAAPVLATLRVLMAYTWHKINQEDPFPGEEAPFDWDSDSFAYQGRFRLAWIAPVARSWWQNRSPANRVSSARQQHPSEK